MKQALVIPGDISRQPFAGRVQVQAVEIDSAGSVITFVVIFDLARDELEAVLRRLNGQPAVAVTAKPADKSVTPPQVAKMFGVNAGKVVGWIRSGELRAVNIAAKTSGRHPAASTCRNSIHQVRSDSAQLVPRVGAGPPRKRNGLSELASVKIQLRHRRCFAICENAVGLFDRPFDCAMRRRFADLRISLTSRRCANISANCHVHAIVSSDALSVTDVRRFAQLQCHFITCPRDS